MGSACGRSLSIRNQRPPNESALGAARLDRDISDDRILCLWVPHPLGDADRVEYAAPESQRVARDGGSNVFADRVWVIAEVGLIRDASQVGRSPITP